MPRDEEILMHLIEMKGTLGELRAGQAAQGAHITAVSVKADNIRESLQTHREDDDAHGAKSSRRASNWIVTLVSLGLGFAGLWIGLRSGHEAGATPTAHTP